MRPPPPPPPDPWRLGLYNLVFFPAFLALLPGYLVRMLRRGGWGPHFGQRLGWYPAALRRRLAAEPVPRLWIQAVSVGEMLVALKLVAALRAAAPARRYLLSTTTTTGFALARRHAGPDLEVLYTPLDFWPCARLAWRSLRPAGLVVVEGGLWPNLLACARRADRPVALVNARVSPRSERRLRRFRGLVAPLLFRPLAFVGVPAPADEARWRDLGVDPTRVRVVGNVKFDDETPGPGVGADPGSPPAAAAAAGAAAGHGEEALRRLLGAEGWAVDPVRPVLLAGSTHADEERVVAEQFLALRARFPDLLLVVVPRHAERAENVARELAALGLRVVRRSRLGAGQSRSPAEVDPAADRGRGRGEAGQEPAALLVDTTGELRHWYRLATVVFVGKSLSTLATGGQNPAEPLAAGKPVVVGPHTENFRELVALLRARRAIVEVADPAGLGAACGELLADPARRARLVAGAGEILASHRGAARRTARLLEGWPANAN